MVAIVTALLLLLGVVGAVSLALAFRHRLAFRLAMRNARRGRLRTVLVLLGLLVGTAIISGALVIGDTDNSVNVHFTYQAIGFTDEAIYNTSLTNGYNPFPYATYVAINQSLRGNPDIAGIAPEIVGTVAAFDRSTGVPQTGLNLIGADPNRSAALGAFHAPGGTALAGPGPNQVYLDSVAASDINAAIGDSLILFSNGRAVATVAAIVQDDTRGGFLFDGSVFTDLATAQVLLNVSGQLNFLAVTNSGSLAGGVARSDSVSASVNVTLAQLGHPSGLKVHEWLKDNLARAETAGASLSTLFLVLGLFSIIAGGILIVGIFIMLAEERRSEMGMLRGIGLRRRQLVMTFYFEGLAYSAGSALGGTVLGVALGYVITYIFATQLSTSQVSSQAILQSFTVTPQTLVIGYVVGFLLTLVTVLIATSRVSRLNIVRAIRVIPEPPPTLRLYTRLAYGGLALIAAGLFLTLETYKGATDVSYPILGGAMVIGGVALLASRFVPNRIAFSVAGAALLVWGGSSYLQGRVLGEGHTGNIFVVFVEGILLVVGALLLYAFNSKVIVDALSWVTSRRPRSVPVVRVGLSYPSRKAVRTTINLLIFALVLFTVVAVASFGASLQANLGQIVQAQSGGYTDFAFSQVPIDNLPAQIQNNSTLRPLFSNVVPLLTGGVAVGVASFGRPYPDGVYAAPSGMPATSNFYATNTYNFTSTDRGMTPVQVWSEIQSNLSVAVVDGTYAAGGLNFGPSAPHPVLSVGTLINLTNPDVGRTVQVRVIGILGQTFLNGAWVNPTTAAQLGFTRPTAYFLTVAPGADPTFAGQRLKVAFFAEGLVLLNFAQLIQQSINSTEAIVGLLEVFVGLGLAVGIAAMGIVALRAVAERRGEIGMLRAQGFTQGMIFRAFLLEYSFVALLGIAIGTALGILIDYNFSARAGGLITFTIPWPSIVLVVLVAYALVVVAVAGPSIKAARLPPAEAVRYSE